MSDQKLLKSLEYSALDHKWIARNYLNNKGWTQATLLKKLSRPEDNTETDNIMFKIALSSFRYYLTHYDKISTDKSLSVVTSLCSSGVNSIDVDASDPEVKYLSHLFNELVGSNRKLLKCYDCGTNARAVFLKLVGERSLSKKETERMSREYLLNKTDPVPEMQKCLKKLKQNDGKHTVFILSVGFQDFGHVWVIDKRYLNSKVRFHQYQSALGSHMLIDFIESMDYGADPSKSLNIDEFFSALKRLLSYDGVWKDEQYRVFSELFAFMPVEPVTKPEPGFCWTWVNS
jgi:hypothetical protein